MPSNSGTSRIASLLPSATEIVHGLGLLDHLVARSHECDYPQNVSSLPVATFATIDTNATSLAIDLAVKDRLQKGLSLYGLHTEILQDLQPDWIITQTQCDVCAVSLRDVKRHLREDLDLDAELVVLAPTRLTDIWEDIQRVGDALQVPAAADHLITSLKERLLAIEKAAQSFTRPKVAMIEWLDPLMIAGNWVPELVATAGGQDCLGRVGQHSDWTTWEALLNADPDVIVLSACGFDLSRTLHEAQQLTLAPQWSQLRAVNDDRVYATDGNAFFNRPGPRVVESAEILAEILHPDRFSFDHQGTAWQRL